MRTPCVCADPGFVRYQAYEDGAGNVTMISHADGWESRYLHQDEFMLEVGQDVARGQQVGWTGTTGHSTGPHLHFELRDHGNPVDPYPLITWDIGEGDMDMTEEQMQQLGQWMQEQTAVVLNTLVGPGWFGWQNLLGQWEQDTRTIINAHTDAVAGGARAPEPEATVPTTVEAQAVDD
jgi:hypothetical protein